MGDPQCTVLYASTVGCLRSVFRWFLSNPVMNSAFLCTFRHPHVPWFAVVTTVPAWRLNAFLSVLSSRPTTCCITGLIMREEQVCVTEVFDGLRYNLQNFVVVECRQLFDPACQWGAGSNKYTLLQNFLVDMYWKHTRHGTCTPVILKFWDVPQAMIPLYTRFQSLRSNYMSNGRIVRCSCYKASGMLQL